MIIARSLSLGLLTVLIGFAQSPPKVLTGTHFADIGDFQTLKLLGYDFAVITVNPSDAASWRRALDAAQAAGIKLVVGGYPPPYTFNNGSWTVTSSGMALLSYLQTRADLILALYVFNEPYSSNPYAGGVTPCGYFSAADLRALRSTIRALWPAAKIYHDIGDPPEWVPGTDYTTSYPCVGNKYADQTGIADYVGVWHYPFTASGYDRTAALSILTRDVNFVLNSMQPALPVSLNQAFACSTCAPGLVWPTPRQLLDWNCATRSLPLTAVAWYPWRKFTTYTQALADNVSYWPLTTAEACGPGMGADAVGLSAASRIPFVAASSLVSVYGSNLAPNSLSASSQPLPTSLGGVTLQVRDAKGNTQPASLAFVSPGQINFMMPGGLSPGQAALALTSSSGTTLQGTALVRTVAPALFSADGSGTGVAAAAAVSVGSDQQQSSLPVYQCGGTACTSVPIDLSGSASVYLVLYGTGIRNYAAAVKCSIKGLTIPVLYAGPQGQYDGLDQVNVGPLVNLGGSGEVDLVLTVDGQASNTVRVNFR